jgi:hypothetical protein
MLISQLSIPNTKADIGPGSAYTGFTTSQEFTTLFNLQQYTISQMWNRIIKLEMKDGCQ